jgi:hypothetical protein
VLKKSFRDDERKFLEPLMRFARGDMRDHIVSHKNDHGASYPTLQSIAVAESAKNQLLRDFRRRSIFDFCNTIGTFETCQGGLMMSVFRGRPEVTARSQTDAIDPSGHCPNGHIAPPLGFDLKR